MQRVYNTPLPVVENEKTETQETQEKNEETITETIDTSNWKTFRNEEYGFEMQIPSDWGMNKDTYPFPPGIGGEWFTAEPIDRVDNGKLRFTVAVFDSMESSEEWIKSKLGGLQRHDFTEKKHVGKYEAYYLQDVSDDLEYWYVDNAYVVSSGEQIFFIQFREKSGPENWQYDYSSSLPIFETFVSSLKFL